MVDNNLIFFKRSYLLFFLLFFGLLFFSLFSGNDIRGVESNVIYVIQHILNDNSLLYQNPNALPYAVTQYTPLYYLICDGILTIFNVQASSVLTVIIMTRCISLLFLGLAAYCFYRICSQFNSQKTLLLFFVSLFILMTFPWYSISRPDVLVLFFMLLGIRTFQIYLQRNHLLLIALVGVICFFAIASKQNGFILPFSIGLFLLINKALKPLLMLLVGFFIGILILYAIISIGGYNLTFIKANVIDGVKNDLDIRYALQKPYLDFVIYFGLFFIVFYKVLNGRFEKWKKTKFSFSFFLILSLITWFLISVVLALKVGSGINYFNEAVVITLLIVFIELSYSESFKDLRLKKYCQLLCIVGIQVCLVHFYKYSIKVGKGIFETYISESSVRYDIGMLLSENLKEGYFLSEDRKINLANYKQCIFPQIEVYQASINQNSFQLEELEEDFKEGRIKYLILYTELKSILNLKIEELFVFDKQIGNLNIYKFRGQ